LENLEGLTAVLDPAEWAGKRVLLTGHTGFKGAWTALVLHRLGAQVTGIALPPDCAPSLHEVLGPWTGLRSIFCDICDRARLAELVRMAAPEIVIHMAAQPLVRRSYQDPVGTIETNVMGTVNLLEALRSSTGLQAILVITSDKVYENDESGAVLTEESPLGGHDPYSASKAAVEVLSAAYARSFFAARGVHVKTARAGNVIGGGDWATDRIIPDLWRAYSEGRPAELRHPGAIRPWQHVLDPVFGYLLYLQRALADGASLPPALNFGPAPEPTRTVLQLAEGFHRELGGPPFFIVGQANASMKEKDFLSIDATLAQKTLGWRPVLDVDSAIAWTSGWYKAFRDGQDVLTYSNQQIDAYIDLARSAPRP
jgi:CDP-glucose 4,6-dehydratase